MNTKRIALISILWAMPLFAHAVPVCDRANPANCVVPDTDGTIAVRQPGTMETATSGNVANAAAAATLATASGKTTYITGLHMSAGGATAAASVDCTITGLITGTQTFTFSFGTLNAYTRADIIYPSPVPASASNTTIVASCPAGGSGAAHASMNLEGFQR